MSHTILVVGKDGSLGFLEPVDGELLEFLMNGKYPSLFEYDGHIFFGWGCFLNNSGNDTSTLTLANLDQNGQSLQHKVDFEILEYETDKVEI